MKEATVVDHIQNDQAGQFSQIHSGNHFFHALQAGVSGCTVKLLIVSIHFNLIEIPPLKVDDHVPFTIIRNGILWNTV